MDVIGCTEVEINGEKYKAKPSFKALITIEEIAGCSLVKICGRFSKSDMRINDVAAILYGCIKAEHKGFVMSYEQFGELVYADSLKNGMSKLSIIAVGIVTNVLTGNTEKKSTGNTKETE